MNGAPNKTRNHSWRFASLACKSLHHARRPWTPPCIYVWTHKYIFIYIYIEREREREREKDSWLVRWGLWHINLCRLFNAKLIFIQIIKQFSLAVKNISIPSYSVYSNSSIFFLNHFSVSTVSISKTVLFSFAYVQSLNIKTVPFLVIQFSIST